MRNAQIVHEWIDATPWLRNMVADPAKRTNTGVCMVFQGDWYESLSAEDQAGVPKKIVSMLEERDVGYDFNGYRDAPPSLRIWCGSDGREPRMSPRCCPGSNGLTPQYKPDIPRSAATVEAGCPFFRSKQEASLRRATRRNSRSNDQCPKFSSPTRWIPTPREFSVSAAAKSM